MSQYRIDVDWQRCEGRGLCFELLPEALAGDPWGYPIVREEIREDLLRQARAAVSACPTLALRLTSLD